jgi:Chaperone of endosialidase
MATTINAGTATGGAAISADTTGILQLQSGSTPTTAITVDASQVVGVGITPNSWSLGKVLQVGASTELWNDGSNSTYLSNNVYYNSAFKYQVTGVAATSYVSGAGAHIWNYAPSGTAGNTITFTEAMRIDSSGNLLVGNTSTNPVASRVNGTNIQSSANGGILTRGGNSNSYFGLSITSGVHINFYTDNGSAFVTAGNISSNGGTTSFNATSDYRMKENVKPMQNALATVAKLNPVTFDWKDEYVGTRKASQGFIAHELQKIVPDCVTGEKDAVNEEGKITPQGVDTSFLVATLTAAIQELNAKVDAQAAEIKALKGGA